MKASSIFRQTLMVAAFAAAGGACGDPDGNLKSANCAAGDAGSVMLDHRSLPEAYFFPVFPVFF